MKKVIYFAREAMAISILTVAAGVSAPAVAQDNYVEIERSQAPSGTELGHLFVYPNGVEITHPGADSGSIQYLGQDSSGNHGVSVDFSQPHSGGSSGGWNEISPRMEDTTISIMD